MKTLAKYHVFNHCVTGGKHLKINLSGPVSYRDFRETGPCWTIALKIKPVSYGALFLPASF